MDGSARSMMMAERCNAVMVMGMPSMMSCNRIPMMMGMVEK